MVAEVSISGGVSITANFDGNSIDVSVSVSSPINIIVQLGYGSDPTAIPHNILTGRDAVDAHPKESITDLTISDSPEFANTQITTLDSVDNGGVIPTAEATWLGVTAKSVLSYLQKLVSKVYAIDSRVSVLENNVIFDITTTQDAVSLIITTDKNGNQLNLTDGTYNLSRYSYNGNNNGGGNISSVLINDINSDVYKQVYAAAGYNGINHKGGNIYSEFDIKLTLKDGVLSWTGLAWGYDTPLGNIGTVTSYGVSIKTLISIPYINKLTVKDQNSSLLIKSGTRFVLKKVD